MTRTTLRNSLLLAAVVATPATSMAGGSGNIGYSTDYVFRGIFQEDSSAYVGADYSTDGGFYVGTWWADVGQGTETDIYLGYNFGGENVKFKVGYTGYLYLDDFDGDYNEINLGLSAGIFSLDVAVGEYDAGTIWGLNDQDYTFTSITISPEKGPYYKYGMWGGDFADNILPLFTKDGTDDGDYLEVGYTWSLEDQGIDFSAALIHSSNLPVVETAFANPNGADYTLTFGIKKTLGSSD
jgi:uncharacterized protein (TIGR02001 family)